MSQTPTYDPKTNPYNPTGTMGYGTPTSPPPMDGVGTVGAAGDPWASTAPPPATHVYDDSTTADVDISGMPYKFNPPIHRVNMPARVDFTTGVGSLIGESNAVSSLAAYQVESGVGDVSKLKGADFNGLRLGRIMQGDTSSGHSSDGPNRWGFRFLYNPASWVTSAQRNDQVILDPRSRSNMVLASYAAPNFQTHTFTLMLNRQPDLADGAKLRGDSYNPKLDSVELAGIRTYGTGWDLEYLCRICNGLMDTINNGRSGNLGLLSPVPSYLILGPGMRHFGFIASFGYTHTMFSPNMVPIMTTVTLSFRRTVDTTPAGGDALAQRLGSEIARGPAFLKDATQTAVPGSGFPADSGGTAPLPTNGNYAGGGGSPGARSVTNVVAAANTTRASATGQCLATVYRVLGCPNNHEHDATQFAKNLAAQGHLIAGFNAPLGAVMCWTGGSSGYGHVTVSAGGGYCWTTDWKGALKETRVSASELDKSWGSGPHGIRYAGWSEYSSATFKLNTSTTTRA